MIQYENPLDEIVARCRLPLRVVSWRDDIFWIGRRNIKQIYPEGSVSWNTHWTRCNSSQQAITTYLRFVKELTCD